MPMVERDVDGHLILERFMIYAPRRRMKAGCTRFIVTHTNGICSMCAKNMCERYERARVNSYVVTMGMRI